MRVQCLVNDWRYFEQERTALFCVFLSVEYKVARLSDTQ